MGFCQEIKNKEIWEEFLKECEEKTFLQSWNWGEFNKMTGSKIWRVGVFEDNNLISTVFFYKIQARRGTFLFVPHGPNIKLQVASYKLQVLRAFLEELKKIAKEEQCDFIRIAPILERNDDNIRIFKDLEFREAPIHIHPELTWELDITKSEEELLAQMRKTTRYLIKQAQKIPDIKISRSQNLDDVKEFDALNQKTVDRHHFVPFLASYLKNEFLVFSPNSQISIFLGRYKNLRRFAPQNLDSSGIKDEIVSSGIFIFWQGIAFYHHGASSLKYPKIPVSYLLIWEAIKEAKSRGCKKFNFWGIAPENEKNHPWAGLSLFKMGFGGYKKEYVKTQDFPFSKKYYLTYFFEKMRKIKRGL